MILGRVDFGSNWVWETPRSGSQTTLGDPISGHPGGGVILRPISGVCYIGSGHYFGPIFGPKMAPLFYPLFNYYLLPST